MTRITRVTGNLPIFGSESLGTERTVFGDTLQSDDLDANITASYRRGWGIIDANEEPPIQDFNGLGYVQGGLLSYLHQSGIPEWDAAQEYYDGAVVRTDDAVYQLAIGGDGSVDPSLSDAWLSISERAGKNSIINGDFRINQREVSGTVTLAAGEYGHDRFQGGSAGCTYTFAVTVAGAVLDITGGSLLQIVRSDNLQSGAVVLSWEGTAQGRLTGNGVTNTPYGDSGEVTIAPSAANNLVCEWGVGTLSKCQLESGSRSSPFEFKLVSQALRECQAYFFRADMNTAVVPATVYNAGTTGTTTQGSFTLGINLPKMRITPTVTTNFGGGLPILRGEAGVALATCTTEPVCTSASSTAFILQYNSSDISDTTQLLLDTQFIDFDAEITL